MLQTTNNVTDDSEPVLVPIVDSGASQGRSRRFQVHKKWSRTGSSGRYSVVDSSGKMMTLWICGDDEKALECARLACQALEELTEKRPTPP